MSRLSIYILLIIILGVFAMKALIHSGFYTSHDGWHQVARLHHFDAAIRQNHIPPKWGGELLFGAGYPLFVFSYHVPWMIAEPFVLSGISIYDSLKIVYIIGFALSGVSMFLWVRDMWGDHAGFLSAFLYMWAPNRFSNVYVRGALGEATVLMFLPLIYWGLYRMAYRYDKKFMLVGAVGIFGALLSHAMIMYLLLIPTVLYGISLVLSTKDKKMVVLRFAGLGLLGLGLSAYYFIPAMYYQKMTVFSQIMSGYYNDHFATLSRLIYSPWGFGFSAPGPGSMSLQLGIAQWFVLGISMLMLCVIAFKNKFNFKKLLLPGSLMLGILFCLFMILPESKPIWKTIEHTIIVDFPWRFLSVSVFLISILAGWCVSAVSNRFFKYSLIGFLVCIALYTNRNHIRVNQYVDIPESVFVQSELTTNTHDEYLPLWGNKEYLTKGKRPFVMDETGNELTNYRVVENTLENKKFILETEKDTKISLNLLYFPFWHAEIDGNGTAATHDANGLMQLNIPKGGHTVYVYFLESFIGLFGIVISVLSVCIAIVLSLPRRMHMALRLR